MFKEIEVESALLTRPMTFELANGKEVISRHTVGNLDFELGEKPTKRLTLGLYQLEFMTES